MALKLKIVCPTHKRYNPEEGEAAIRGGCKMCRAMFTLYRQALKVMRQEWEQLHTESAEEIGEL